MVLLVSRKECPPRATTFASNLEAGEMADVVEFMPAIGGLPNYKGRAMLKTDEGAVLLPDGAGTPVYLEFRLLTNIRVRRFVPGTVLQLEVD